jgi:hypothetical protein
MEMQRAAHELGSMQRSSLGNQARQLKYVIPHPVAATEDLGERRLCVRVLSYVEIATSLAPVVVELLPEAQPQAAWKERTTNGSGLCVK